MFKDIKNQLEEISAKTGNILRFTFWENNKNELIVTMRDRDFISTLRENGGTEFKELPPMDTRFKIRHREGVNYWIENSPVTNKEMEMHIKVKGLIKMIEKYTIPGLLKMANPKWRKGRYENAGSELRVLIQNYGVKRRWSLKRLK